MVNKNNVKNTSPLHRKISAIGAMVNKANEQTIAVLIFLLVLDVWLGIVARYIFHWQIPWTEELARYIMIWGILLAVPCCCYRREHIGLTSLQGFISESIKPYLHLLLDLVALIFFLILAYTGTAFVEKGLSQFSTVYSIPMAVPYAAIPAAFLLAAFQTCIAMFRDFGCEYVNEDSLGGTDI
ncbi:MAG: TRAP transporter small permease [Oceanospirillaceae bacterium]|nr:TRAP transporter small permease [Oceanospirillaceae bacterium]